MSLSLTGSDFMQPGGIAAVLSRCVALVLLVAGCATAPQQAPAPVAVAETERHAVTEPEAAAAPVSATPVLELGDMPDLEGIIPKLAQKRVVLVGETHNRYDHHLTQLEIIRRLHALDARLAIGMEAFQQPFQGVLDDYVAGRLDERDMLRNSEYFSRWRFDYRLYAPILRYAREHRVPVIALNLPQEITRKVAREGLAALTETEQAQLPDQIDRSDKDYEQRLKQVFDRHPDNGRSFERFLDVQLLWDEGMAKRAADYLGTSTDARMVILAGSGHLAWGSGIPQRLARRLPESSSAVVLNGWTGELGQELADFVLLTEPRQLPPSGKFGLLLDSEQTVPTVEICMSDSPCSRAGLKRGDRFLSIDGERISDMTDLHLAMWDKQPGDSVVLRISRKRWFRPDQELSYTIELR